MPLGDTIQLGSVSPRSSYLPKKNLIKLLFAQTQRIPMAFDMWWLKVPKLNSAVTLCKHDTVAAI